jgi:ATP-dependent RNA helicase DeaD
MAVALSICAASMLDIPLPSSLSEALDARGYDSLTPVQASVLEAPSDQDLIVSAQTGSGKTVAFGLAMAAKRWPRGRRRSR